ncbi:guanine nucleotide exchange C9orf72 homolog isoform X2 [Amblyraja radiata]|uniref:guanine nucleotide exchange C9orf72 homolog isoform X2 n=1 Tax=Amblyraja radiata TaxID=386614 RepID=UPI0014032283|nr:guanine nucleotide exchange C9orf72 homolog isoform X2 [Amblyraja radiata]
MCAACPPQSPAVAKTEIMLDGDSPLLAATFAYWDNILGPRVRHIWAPKFEQLLLSDGEITFLANHTLNGEILRSAKSGAIDVKFFVLSEKGVIIISLIFDGNMNGDRSTYALSVILPQTELGFYLPLHRLCVDRLTHIIRKGRIWMYKGQSIISFLTTEITPIMELFSSMKTHGVPQEVQMVRTLCLFLTPTERKCSRLANTSGSFKYNSGLFVQGLLKDSTGSFVLPYRQIMYAPYPTTHIDVDVNTVMQMAPCHEHIYNQQNYMSMELVTLQKTASEDVEIPDTLIHMDEGFTPNLNIFQDVMNRDTLVKSFLDQIFQLESGLSLRNVFLAQFLLVLHRKAQTVIKYIEDETQRGKKPFKSLRNLKVDLDLTVEGDLSIIMAMAEKLKPGLHSFIFGKSFHTSVQERDVLMSL